LYKLFDQNETSINGYKKKKKQMEATMEKLKDSSFIFGSQQTKVLIWKLKLPMVTAQVERKN
jgi:hypothetical protein